MSWTKSKWIVEQRIVKHPNVPPQNFNCSVQYWITYPRRPAIVERQQIVGMGERTNKTLLVEFSKIRLVRLFVYRIGYYFGKTRDC